MATKLIEEKGLLYELNEKGERVLVRSTESNARAYLRFTNKTSGTINLWWRDFSGKRHHYISLKPYGTYDVNSYVTHAWEFTDVATDERYVINNTEIFRPPIYLRGMMFRTNWNITGKVRSLQHIALLCLAKTINYPFTVEHLGLPKTLEEDLERLAKKVHYFDRKRPRVVFNVTDDPDNLSSSIRNGLILRENAI